jgi:hypothetical protein
MHHQVKIQEFYILSTLYSCVLHLFQNKQWLGPVQHTLLGFCNRDEKYLLRGTDWVFK